MYIDNWVSHAVTFQQTDLYIQTILAPEHYLGREFRKVGPSTRSYFSVHWNGLRHADTPHVSSRGSLPGYSDESQLRLDGKAIELTGVCICLSVKVESDNKTIVALIYKQGTVKSFVLHRYTTILLLWCQTRNVRLLAFYVPAILNVLADKLSRPNQIIHTEWSLRHSVVQLIFQTWTSHKWTCSQPVLGNGIRVLHPNPQTLNLHAWLVQGKLFQKFHTRNGVLDR